jgi:hypothetical protein
MTLLYGVSCRKGSKAMRLLNKLSPTIGGCQAEKKPRILYWSGFHNGEGQNLRFSTIQGFSGVLVFWVLQAWGTGLFQGLFTRVPFFMGKGRGGSQLRILLARVSPKAVSETTNR